MHSLKELWYKCLMKNERYSKKIKRKINIDDINVENLFCIFFQKFQFDRLLKAIDELIRDNNIDETVYAQLV